MSIALWLHLMGVVVWVGGMAFAHFALRPAAQMLAPPQRLPLLAATLGRFLTAVAGSIVAILGSGVWLIAALGGMGAVGPAVQAMTGFGIAMMLIYGHLVAVPYRRLRSAVAAAAWERAGAAMATIRRLIAVNLGLGVLTLTIAVFGRGA